MSRIVALESLEVNGALCPPRVDTCAIFQLPWRDSLKYTREPSVASGLNSSLGSPSLVSWVTASTSGFGAALRHHNNAETISARQTATANQGTIRLEECPGSCLVEATTESDEAEKASNANPRSKADWKRSSGAFSRQRRMTLSTAGGIFICSAENSAGSSFKMALSVSADVAPLNARLAERSS
jgi:hypothetical protein